MKKGKKWLSVLKQTLAALACVAAIYGVIWATVTAPGIETQYTSFPIHLSANTSFSLSPIYLQGNQRLHFTWQVMQGGEITVGLVTPTGEFFGFCADSDSLKKDNRVPLKSGSTAFRPREYGWGTGYYEVQMTAHSQTTELEVRYWID